MGGAQKALNKPGANASTGRSREQCRALASHVPAWAKSREHPLSASIAVKALGTLSFSHTKIVIIILIKLPQTEGPKAGLNKQPRSLGAISPVPPRPGQTTRHPPKSHPGQRQPSPCRGAAGRGPPGGVSAALGPRCCPPAPRPAARAPPPPPPSSGRPGQETRTAQRRRTPPRRRTLPRRPLPYLGQPGLLGLLQLEDAAGLQEGDEGQTLGLVDGGELLPPADLAIGVVELGKAGRALCRGTAGKGDRGHARPLPKSSPKRVPPPLTFPSVTSGLRRCRASSSREQSSTFCCSGKASWVPRPPPASRSPNTSEITRETCRSPTRLGTGDAGESPVGRRGLQGTSAGFARGAGASTEQVPQKGTLDPLLRPARRCPPQGFGSGTAAGSSYSPPGSGLSRVWLRTSSSTTSTARLGRDSPEHGAERLPQHGHPRHGGAVRGSQGPRWPWDRWVLRQALTCRHPRPCEHHRRPRRPCGRRTGARRHPGRGHQPPAEAPYAVSLRGQRHLPPPAVSPCVPTCPSRSCRMAVSCSLV